MVVFLGSEVVLFPVVSGCLPSCGGRVLVGVAASRTETFRDQNHRLQSKFACCKLFGVYAGVSLFWYLFLMVCGKPNPSRTTPNTCRSARTGPHQGISWWSSHCHGVFLQKSSRGKWCPPKMSETTSALGTL